MHTTTHLTRRDFLKLTALSLGGLALNPFKRIYPDTVSLPDFPQSERLGRVCKGKWDIKARPDPDSQTVGVVYEDAVFPWISEVVGEKPNFIFNNQRWVETPDGYIYAPFIQPVRNLPNQPVQSLPQSSLGPGMWVEVTVPYVEASLENNPSSNSWISARLEQNLPIRLYYSQIFWIDQIKTGSSGKTLYRVNPNYYGGVDMLWAEAAAFRPVTADDVAPINPGVENKHVVVDVIHQALSCFEGSQEIYYCRVSTGAKFDMYGNVVDKWSTPVGQHRVSRKYISLQMSGGTTGAGYDLPGIGWTSIFATGGVAIHSTFWHNNYGDPMSHGCVNTLPEDAHWIFRWTEPSVSYDPGTVDVSVTGEASTGVQVVDQVG
jgi:lipoprotein-anchoring transpeptidase ErfK/SrfK